MTNNTGGDGRGGEGWEIRKKGYARRQTVIVGLSGEEKARNGRQGRTAILRLT